jgi:hypothetical protein
MAAQVRANATGYHSQLSVDACAQWMQMCDWQHDLQAGPFGFIFVEGLTID